MGVSLVLPASRFTVFTTLAFHLSLDAARMLHVVCIRMPVDVISMSMAIVSFLCLVLR